MAPNADPADVAQYLDAHVADELQRLRLRSLANELRPR